MIDFKDNQIHCSVLTTTMTIQCLKMCMHLHSTCSCCTIPIVCVHGQVTAGHLSSGEGLARNFNGFERSGIKALLLSERSWKEKLAECN